MLGGGRQCGEGWEGFGLIILKVVEENGEELLADVDDENELNSVYDKFMEELFAEDDEEE